MPALVPALVPAGAARAAPLPRRLCRLPGDAARGAEGSDVAAPGPAPTPTPAPPGREPAWQCAGRGPSERAMADRGCPLEAVPLPAEVRESLAELELELSEGERPSPGTCWASHAQDPPRDSPGPRRLLAAAARTLGRPRRGLMGRLGVGRGSPGLHQAAAARGAASREPVPAPRACFLP